MGEYERLKKKKSKILNKMKTNNNIKIILPTPNFYTVLQINTY